jgi:protein O-GlcNAc transferase
LVPNSAPVHGNLGYLLVQKGDLDGAIAEWREAARLDPQYAPPHANLGEALESKGDTQGAIAAYEQFLVLAPQAPNAAEVRNRLSALKSAGEH